MKRTRILRLTMLAVAMLCGGLQATTWYVGGPGSDFDQIQPAIDAAMPGDLILVRPIAPYNGFILTKGLTVRSTSARFETEWARIANIPEGSTACLGGFDIRGDSPMSVLGCDGKVTIEDGLVSVYSWWFETPPPVLEIEDCAFVQLTEVEVQAGTVGDYAYGTPEPALRIANSTAVLCGVKTKGWTGRMEFDWHYKAGPGGAGVGVQGQSRVLLARVEIVGGKGGKGAPGDWVGNTGEGGDGGPGLLAASPKVMTLGCCGDLISGGDGGDGGDDWYTNEGPGGDGGPGSSGWYIDVSGVELSGGKGGLGRPNGDDGPPYVGDPIFVDPPYPVLDMEGDIHPGSRFDVTVRGQPGHLAVLLLSDTPCWLPIHYRPGPPLVAAPGGWFIAFPAGTLGPSGELTVTLTMLADPVVQGFALTAQAALLPGDQTFVLSNAATRVVAE
ncbi:MAG: hypothetical protein AB1486_32455 [Planctomycetota bacterium]